MLILASASPRRLELLERVGIEVVVRPSDVDESQRRGETAGAYVRRVAADKAAACVGEPGQWVLAADTIVEVDGDVLGKPADAGEARAMLARLVGRTHRVTTAVCLRGGERTHELTVTTEVDMESVSGAMVDDYVDSDEWRGKAGAYAVQGMAAALVRGVRGSITNVIGLPLAEVVDLLQSSGAATVAFRRGRPA